jgi:hypothetical protein
MLRSAPLSATPVPLSVSRALTGVPMFLSCSCELEFTVTVPAVGAVGTTAPRPTALGCETRTTPPLDARVNAPV